MNTLIRLTSTAAIVTSSLLISLNANASMDPHIEEALIDVCKSAQQNKVHNMRKTIKSYRLKEEVVASNVMCNGENIIGFAENNGAYKTAAHLNKQLGESQITDLASIYSVTF